MLGPPSHRPIRVKPARSCPASIRNIRMANDHTQNALSRSLGRRTDVVSCSTGAALRPVSDDVAPAQAGISLNRRGVRERSREAARRVGRTIHHLPRGRSTAPTAHERSDEHDQPTGVPQRQWRVRVTVVENARHPGPVSRVASWAVDVAIPKMIPDHVTARFRRRLRSADDRLERTAHGLTRHRFDTPGQIPTGTRDD